MRHLLTRLSFTCFAWLALSASAVAQNTSGTHSPFVKPDDKSMEYRLTIDTENDRFAQRLHFQQSINDQLRWRVIVQTRETDSSVISQDYLRTELLWH